MRDRLNRRALVVLLLSLTACQAPLASPPPSSPSPVPPPRSSPLALRLDGGWDVTGKLHATSDASQFLGDAIPDAALAVGPSVVLVATNAEVQLRRRSGDLLEAATWPDLFAPVHADQGFTIFDPRAVYDPDSGRFFVSILSASKSCQGGARCPSAALLAVSTSSDPGGFDAASWHTYSLPASSRLAPGVVLDFDSLAVSTGSVVMIVHTLNLRSNSQLSTRLWALPRAGLLSGSAPKSWFDLDPIRDGAGASLVSLMPARSSNRTDPTYLVGLSPSSPCDLDVTAVDGPPEAPRLTSQTVASSIQCAAPTPAAQPGTSTRLAVGITGGGLASEPIYRDGHLWMAWTTGTNGAAGAAPAVAWAEIDVSRWPRPPTLVQEAILGGGGAGSFYPVLAAGAGGTVVMTFGRASTSEFPSLYFTGRQKADPPGTLRPPVLVEASARAADEGRFGDYFAAAADPADGSVWLLGTYVLANAKSGMWLGHVT